jgi:ubiquinone/menaquinone biosynthesis C-methylase UbiE
MDRKELEAVIKAAIALVPPAPTARVLDVEAGLGELTLLLARKAAHVDAIDSSDTIVMALRARLTVAKLANVEARAGDPTALPFPERSFDGAYLLSVINNGDGALAELRRVLKPGATAVVAAVAEDRDALVEDLQVAGFDEVVALAVPGAKTWLATGVA